MAVADAEVADAYERGYRDGIQRGWRVVPGPHIPIKAPDYTMKTAQGHPPIPVPAPVFHRHRFDSFSRVIEACCDSMHYWCECGEHDPCHE